MTVNKNNPPGPGPSLYPTADVYNPIPMSTGPDFSHTPTSHTSSSISGNIPITHELLLELPATIEPPSINGTLRIFQFTKQASFHAFLSLDTINIPLLPTCPVYKRNARPPTYELHIPDREFTLITREPEPELIDALERILKWFCQWDGVGAAGIEGSTNNSSVSVNEDRFARAGEKGVQFVESVGGRVNASIQRRLTRRMEVTREAPPKDIKLGGGVTNAVLTGARSVVGFGAKVASMVTEKVSDVVGKGLAKNPVTKNLAAAPEGSGKKKFHDDLMSGLMAFGKVYVAADQQGKIIIQSVGDGGAELAAMKYGKEAENAARKLGGIALDGYRIARFPEKMGATSLLKGALKSKAQTSDGVAENGKYVVPEAALKSKAQTSDGVAENGRDGLPAAPSFVSGQEPPWSEEYKETLM